MACITGMCTFKRLMHLVAPPVKLPARAASVPVRVDVLQDGRGAVVQPALFQRHGRLDAGPAGQPEHPGQHAAWCAGSCWLVPLMRSWLTSTHWVQAHCQLSMSVTAALQQGTPALTQQV